MRIFLLALMLMIPALCMQAQEFNYDESKVPSYTLPDALTTLKGKKVKTVIPMNSFSWQTDEKIARRTHFGSTSN